MKKQKLKDMALVHILNDIKNKDLTVIDELLNFVPNKYLKGFLRHEVNTDNLTTFDDFENAALQMD